MGFKSMHNVLMSNWKSLADIFKFYSRVLVKNRSKLITICFPFNNSLRGHQYAKVQGLFDQKWSILIRLTLCLERDCITVCCRHKVEKIFKIIALLCTNNSGSIIWILQSEIKNMLTAP